MDCQKRPRAFKRTRRVLTSFWRCEKPMAPDETFEKQADYRAAFLENERQVRISTGKLACALVFVLMPLGVTADYFVYPEHLAYFLMLRILCSLIVAGVWLLHYTSFA